MHFFGGTLKTLRRPLLLSILLIPITFVAYWPLRHAEFICYDDSDYVTDNPEVLRGPTWHGVVWAFTRFHSSNWHPLTWLSHMVDCSLFGANPAGPHMVNVGFHVANALLLLLLLRRLTGAVWRSGFVAALFALHPLHVESVAWISERKDVLSTFFFLLTIWAYVRFAQTTGQRDTGQRNDEVKVESRSSKFEAVSKSAGRKDSLLRTLCSVVSGEHSPSSIFYFLALALFALGLMSKPMVVTLPFVLLLLDYWPLGRFQPALGGAGQAPSRQLIAEKLPLFLLSVASSIVTFWAQKSTGAVVTFETIPLSDRLANAAIAYGMYAIKAFWPSDLALPYPFILDLPAMKVVVAGICLLGTTVLCFMGARRAPYLLVGWLWFVGTLVPVIGLVQVGGQAMADRYTYIPLIGLFIMVAWGAVDLSARWWHQELGLAVLAGVILTGCFICTRFQIAHWRNSFALFSHTIEVTKRNALAEEKLGFTLALSRKLPEAMRHFDAALQLSPDYQPALLNRAHTILLLGRIDEAIAGYREAISNRPASNERAYYQLACALILQKKWNEAKTNFLTALRCNPDSAEAHTKLGNLLWREGDRDGAMPHFCEAVRIKPGYAEAQYNLGNALAQQQKSYEAVSCLRAALKADPNYAQALNDLAWILATDDNPAIRNVPEAIRLARCACELTGNKNSWLLDTLGVAQSEAGQFSEAIRITEEAAALAAAAGDERTEAGLRRRLDFYRKQQPYRSIPR
jgi:tetratricopeptide (TPR) repeat protein